MTLAVTISHATAGYPMRARITPLDANGVPHGSPDHVHAYQKVLADGESATLYVYSGSILRVEEIGPAPAPATPEAAQAAADGTPGGGSKV